MGTEPLKREVKKFPYVANLDELKALSSNGATAFTSEEGASKMLGVPKSTLKQLEGRGDLNGYRLKGGSPDKDHVFIDLESIKAYQARKVIATREAGVKALAKAALAQEAALAKEALAKEAVGAAS